MNKSVLILTSPFRPNIGGVETHLDDLVQEGVSLGYRFYIVSYQPLVTRAKGASIERGKGYTVYRLPWVRLNLFLILEKYPILEFLYLFPGLFIGAFVFLVFNHSKIDIIHSQGLIAGAVGVFLSKIFSKEVIISTHSIYHFPKEGLYKGFVKYLFENSKQILTLSNQSRQEVLDLGISSKRVSVFTYWVDQQVFAPFDKEKARKLLNIDKEVFVCLFVGRLVEVKGIRELLQAVNKTLDVMFLIIGDGPLAREVKEAEKNLSNILFVGKIKNSKLPLYINASDVLIVPSTHEEGFGRVILEALSCGVPVIGANRGGIKEVITSKVGRLFDITPANISLQLNDLLRNPIKLKKMRQSARRYARVRFSNKNIKQITKFYEA